MPSAPKRSVVRLPVLTPWQAHVRKWEHCQRCSLHECRAQTVLYDGELPCDVLFVGEAPGRNEDAVGKPFVGPAGDVMRQIVERALERWAGRLRWGLCNLIACIPLDEDGQLDDPPDEAVGACAPRLVELVRMARPKVIVRVGKHAQDWLAQGFRHSIKVPFEGRWVDLLHPGAMIRKPDAFRDQDARTAAVTVRKACEEVFGCPPP